MSRLPAQVIVLIDALGWELAGRTDFLAGRLPHRRRLRTILGYSSAAIPSLLTGKRPQEHGHWFLYLRASKDRRSPFRGAGLAARLPRRLRDRWILRRRLGAWWRKSADLRGYFGLYEVPYAALKDLDYLERRDTWAAGTFEGGSYIDDILTLGEPVHVSDWRIPDDAKFDAALRAALGGDTRVFVLYLTEIDAGQHEHGSRGAPVEARLRNFEARIEELTALLERRGPVSLTVCSDHGMTDVTRVVDPGPALNSLRARLGKRSLTFTDSTFIRFWVDDDGAAERIRSAFGGQDWCRVLADEDLGREGVFFPDGRYGHVFVLAHPGVLICPSFMGRSPLRGMHGYSPDDPASDAVLLRGVDDGPGPGSILDLRRLFRSEIAGGKG